MAHAIEEYEEFLENAYDAIECMKVQIQILLAREEEQERLIDRFKVRLEMMNSALARLKEILNDPPWEKM